VLLEDIRWTVEAFRSVELLVDGDGWCGCWDLWDFGLITTGSLKKKKGEVFISWSGLSMVLDLFNLSLSLGPYD
jgi:hypothetical protein